MAVFSLNSDIYGSQGAKILVKSLRSDTFSVSSTPCLLEGDLKQM